MEYPKHATHDFWIAELSKRDRELTELRRELQALRNENLMLKERLADASGKEYV